MDFQSSFCHVLVLVLLYNLKHRQNVFDICLDRLSRLSVDIAKFTFQGLLFSSRQLFDKSVVHHLLSLFGQDLVHTTHVFLKIMEHMSKNKHLLVSKKTKKKPTKVFGLDVSIYVKCIPNSAPIKGSRCISFFEKKL